MGVGLRFEETMRGHLAPATGAPPRSMTLRACVESTSITGLWLSEPMPLTGSMDIEGVVAAAPTTGTIEVDLLRCRRIVYDLAWLGTDGARGRFYGWKSLQLLSPLRSCTELTGKVVQEGKLVGEAVLRFDLRDLPAFLRTFRPRRRR
jgi:hypothetical protein